MFRTNHIISFRRYIWISKRVKHAALDPKHGNPSSVFLFCPPPPLCTYIRCISYSVTAGNIFSVDDFAKLDEAFFSFSCFLFLVSTCLKMPASPFYLLQPSFLFIAPSETSRQRQHSSTTWVQSTTECITFRKMQKYRNVENIRRLHTFK